MSEGSIVAEHGKGLAAAVAICIREQDEIVAEADRDLFGDAPAPRGPGRPEGALNRATELQAEVIRRSGLSPLAYLASVWRNPEADTKARVAAAVAALPYVHKRQPVAVDLSGAGQITLVIGDVGEGGAQGALDGEFELVAQGPGADAENGENPPIASRASDGSPSDGLGQVVETSSVSPASASASWTGERT